MPIEGGIKQCYNPTVQPFICLQLNNGAFWGYSYYTTLIGNRMLEVKPTGHNIWPLEVAKTTKPSLLLLQKHLLGLHH